MKVEAMLLPAYAPADRLRQPTPWRAAKFLAAAIAAGALSQPTQAQTVVYECKVSQSDIAGAKKIYSEAERQQPDLHTRFAFNVPKGRGCIVVKGACDESVGRLHVEQDENTITARGASPPLILSYGFIRKAFYLLVGDDSWFSDRNDCREIELSVVMP